MAKSKSLPIVGTGELVYMLGVTRARVVQLSKKPGFPEPIELLMGQVWKTDDVLEWAAAAGRELRPLPATWPAAPEGGVKGAPVTSGAYRK